MDSPVGQGVSPTAATPTGFFSQRFWGFISPHWNPELCSLSHSTVVPPSLSTCKCGTIRSTSHCLVCPVCQLPLCCTSFPSWLPVSAPSASLDECFFFNSLVVGLPYSSIFHEFWLFFVFTLVVVLLLILWGNKEYLPTLPSWLEAPFFQIICNFLLRRVFHFDIPNSAQKFYYSYVSTCLSFH